MFFSKSFGYALRGVLYIASSPEKPRVRIEELADQLKVPRHFLGKVMKSLVKHDILNSTKGPTGGFHLNDKTMDTPLIRFIEITDDPRQFDTCVLRLEKCNAQNPCPLHRSMEESKKKLADLFSGTTIRDLVKEGAQHPLSGLVTV